jgi:hypothetical protein
MTHERAAGVTLSAEPQFSIENLRSLELSPIFGDNLIGQAATVVG